MSKQNKVNKTNYNQAGRLTPDELAREYKKQAVISHAKDKERVIAKTPQTPAERGDTPSRNESEE